MIDDPGEGTGAIVPRHPGLYIGHGLAAILDEAEHRYENEILVGGISTGFPDLDSKFDGLQPGYLYLFAGRPSHGKSALAVNIAANAAAQSDGGALVVSNEISAIETHRRILSSEALVDISRLRTAQLDEREWSRVSHAVGRLADHDLAVIESALTVQLIEDYVDRAKKLTVGSLVVVVDCINGLHSEHPKGWDSRHAELSDISRRLKNIALDNHVAVVATAQVNRSVEARTDKRPMLGDLLDSSSLESAADVVIFTYRDELYDEYTPNKGILELLIAKNRLGPSGRVRLAFRPTFTRADNIASSVPRSGAPEDARAPEALRDLDEAPPSARTGELLRPDIGGLDEADSG